MTAKELRNLDTPALQSQLQTWQAEYYSVRENTRTGKEKNHARLAGLRRDIARAHTLVNELTSKSVKA